MDEEMGIGSKFARIRKLWVNLLISFGALLFACFILEIGARVLGVAPEVVPISISRSWGDFASVANPILRYLPRPGSPGVNSAGFRDVDYPPKVPGAKRVIVVGDSIPYGYCNFQKPLSIHETFPRQLQDLLNQNTATDSKFQVLNLSVSGYDTTAEAELIRVYGIAQQPDLVVLSYCLNDRWQASGEFEALEHLDAYKDPAPQISDPFGPWQSATRELFLASHLYRWISLKVRSLKQGNPSNSPEADPSELGFKAISKMAKKHNFQVLVTIFPFFDGFTNYSHLVEHQRTKALAEKYGFAFLDLLPIFAHESKGNDQLLEDPCELQHPNALAHHIAAQALQPLVVKILSE